MRCGLADPISHLVSGVKKSVGGGISYERTEMMDSTEDIVNDDTEYLVPKKILAAMLNISERTFERLISKGILVPVDEPRQGVRRLFNVRENLSNFTEYMKERHERKEPTEAELESAYWDMEYKKARAKIKELEAQELRGEVHRAEDITHFTEEAVYSVRGMMMTIPGRVAVDVANTTSQSEIAGIIQREVDYILVELNRHKYDPAKYAERVRERHNMKAQSVRVDDD